MRLTVLTTSFPLAPGSVSGIFVERLLVHLPGEIHTTVLTPGATAPVARSQLPHYQLRCFRYAPLRWQRLAHEPGGVPAALQRHRLFYLLLPFFLAAMFFACLRLARESDLIHANWSVNGIVAGLAGLMTRTAVITTLRGTDVNRVRGSRVYALLLRLCLLLSRRVVTVSETIRRNVAARYPALAHKLVFIPNGVDEAFFRVRPEPGSGKVRLVSIGALVPGKGLDQILFALGELSDPGRFALTVFGDGPERSKLEALMRSLGLASEIRFAGTVPPAQIPLELARADIFVLASNSEGRPNVVLEAMAAGLPVIASRIGGVDELIRDGETGLLFEPGQPQELARKISELVHDPDLQKRLGSAARKFMFDQRLHWQDTSRRYVELYQQVASQALRPA